jgi:hypothetical protein
VTFEPGAAGFSLRTDLITTLKSWIDGPVPRRHPISSVVVGARGFELQTSCAQDKSANSRKTLPRNRYSENKTFSSLNGMCAGVSGCVHLIAGSLQKPLQRVGPYNFAMNSSRPP